MNVAEPAFLSPSHRRMPLRQTYRTTRVGQHPLFVAQVDAQEPCCEHKAKSVKTRSLFAGAISPPRPDGSLFYALACKEVLTSAKYA